jgi:hypothetical protein
LATGLTGFKKISRVGVETQSQKMGIQRVCRR